MGSSRGDLLWAHLHVPGHDEQAVHQLLACSQQKLLQSKKFLICGATPPMLQDASGSVSKTTGVARQIES